MNQPSASRLLRVARSEMERLCAHPRLRYRPGLGSTLLNLDDFAGIGGRCRMAANCQPHEPAVAVVQEGCTRWHFRPETLSRPKPAISREFFQLFASIALDLTLDSHRYKGKNTHELIVLPAFRQVLPAKCFGLRQRSSSQRCPASQGPLPPPSGFILARGLSVGALASGPRICRSIPTKTFTADRR